MLVKVAPENQAINHAVLKHNNNNGLHYPYD